MRKICLGVLVLSLFITSCKNTDKEKKDKDSIDLEALRRDTMMHAGTDTLRLDSSALVANEDSIAIAFSNSVLMAIRDRDYEKLANFIDPDEGVVFFPYSYITKDNQKENHFSRNGFLQKARANTKKTWGHADGSGDPITLSVREYLRQYVYDADYLITNRVSANKSLFVSSNGIDNSLKIFKDNPFVDYYKKPKAGENDFEWSNLRFILNKKDGNFYLVAVVRNVWQI